LISGHGLSSAVIFIPVCMGGDFEGSRIYNVSRLDENYEIAYEPTWIEV
jgi:hypothetical protein